jgi:5-methylcytosine-specific restriction endonuclease McrA
VATDLSDKRSQGQKLRYRGAVVNTVHTCKTCTSDFKPKRSDRTIYCSRECGFAGQAKARSERADLKPLPACSVSFINCRECAGMFASRISTAIYCTPSCSSRAASRAKTEHKRAARRCPCCGQMFSPPYGRSQARYCSDACSVKQNRRVGRAARRARERGATVEVVDPFKVFDRDGWRCCLCNIATPRSLRGTLNDRAPELDHIVPLAAGGEHSYRNTQCACRRCNSSKGSTPKGQMRMFA